jgi:dinuclear metal center YbgI/SA1388 family protein
MAVKVKDIQHWLDTRYPPRWAEAWDRIGLQVGNPDQWVERLGISLEATPRSVAWARAKDLQLMIAHHPLFFQPQTSINIQVEPGRTAAMIMEAGFSLIAAHTNLDASPEGVSTALAGRLNMTDLGPLENRVEELVKLILFIPLGYEEKITSLLDTPHSGRIGPYRLCTFKTLGEGTYMPEAESHPFKGEQGRMERAAEWRLEVLTEKKAVGELIQKIRQAHPYEEMAFDVYPVQNPSERVGLGRVGRFNPAIPWSELIHRLKEAVEAPWVRVSGTIPNQVGEAALCGGSGGGMISRVLSSGVKVFICGEIGYHPIISCEGQDLTLIEIGHYPSEKWIIPLLAETIREAGRQERWDITIFENREPGDPYSRYF